MKIKKILAVIMAVTMLFGVFAIASSAADEGALPLSAGIEKLKEQFVYGAGPETDGITIDYRYFSPVTDGDGIKYPLVIWLHGLGDGGYEGKQVDNSEIAYWTSADFQSRFTGSNGAYIFAARVPEDKGVFWGPAAVYPLRAAIDDFIAQNKESIDIGRIYIGGYSMGGMMTLRMSVAYPDMFAAAFPICPAWMPTEEELALCADVPMWLTSGVLDPLVSYRNSVEPTWEKIVKTNNNPEDCRFSTLEMVTYATGLPTSSAHHAWFAVNYDMFNAKNGDYQYMTTVNGAGEKVKLEYPNGMIYWLSQHTSDFDGNVATDSGNIDPEGPVDMGIDPVSIIENIISIIKDIFIKLLSILSMLGF